MFARLERELRHFIYTLRGGFLVRPLVIAAAIGLCGIVFPLIEEGFPGIDAWLAQLPVIAPHDPGAAAGIFASVIGAMMTVVSIVLSVLLVAITFASIQFSPRILSAFVEDRPNQRTIGIFLGTFVYCLFVYSSARATPPTTPALAVLGAMVLALACIAALVGFVSHIARSINVNFITDRIATATERVVDEMMPALRAELGTDPGHPLPDFDGPLIRASRSGYIRYVDVQRLLGVAKDARLAVSLERM